GGGARGARGGGRGGRRPSPGLQYNPDGRGPPRDEPFQTPHGVVKAARASPPAEAWDYLVGGTERETTLRRNRQALDAVALRPRVLRDVSRIACTTRLFERSLRLPVFLAPIGSIETFTPGGGATAARGAAAFGVPLMLSSVCR